jgi:uncharacterized protein YggU (UPF0235/DUF167 family)
MIFIDYILENNNNWVIHVKIIPNAKHSEFVDVMENGVIKIKISAIPEKWKANKELVDYLSSELRLKKDCIHIISWITSQIKKIKLDI